MRITTPMTGEQLRKIHNLMVNCTTKQAMFEHLIDIGVNAFHALHMSNSFKRITSSVTVLAPCGGITAREYVWSSYENKLIQVN